MKTSTSSIRTMFVFLTAVFFFSNSLFSQDSLKVLKNSVKFNVTNMLLYDNSYQFSYERIIKKNQSINVVLGYQEFPLITIDLDAVNFAKNSKRTGFSAGVDYRFYLGDINKYSAPRGVYLAPFVSFFQFSTDRGLVYTDPNTGVSSTANLSSKLNLTNFGGELGYQFVIAHRIVIDCVLLGPSLTRYKFNVKMDNQLSGLDNNEVYQKVVEAIKNKYPGVGNLTDGNGIEKKGTQSITAVGFRYNISIGYRF